MTFGWSAGRPDGICPSFENTWRLRWHQRVFIQIRIWAWKEYVNRTSIHGYIERVIDNCKWNHITCASRCRLDAGLYYIYLCLFTGCRHSLYWNEFHGSIFTNFAGPVRACMKVLPVYYVVPGFGEPGSYGWIGPGSIFQRDLADRIWLDGNVYIIYFVFMNFSNSDNIKLYFTKISSNCLFVC